MKALKPIIALMALAALLGIGFALLDRRSGHDLLLTNATAAPITGRDGDVAVFLKIENAGPPDRLLAVSSPVATGASLDAPSGALAIPEGAAPTLSADGAFLRLSGVQGTYDDGRMIPVTLEFEHAGRQSVQARLVAPRDTGEAAQVGLFGIGGICRVGEGEPAPELSLTTRPDGDGWVVDIATASFEFRQDLADGPHIPGTGHGHLYLNGMKLQRLYDASARIGVLPPGRHEVQVTLNTNDHRAYVVGDDPVVATAVIDVLPD